MSSTDNFDGPENEEPNLENDFEFDEFEKEGSKPISDSLKNNALVKFALVAVAILLVIALVSLFGGDSADAPQSFVGKGEANFKETPGTKEVTPVMKQALEERNDQRVEEAQKQGISAIPTPIEPPKAILETSAEDNQAEDPLLRWQQMQLERAQAQRVQEASQSQQPQTDPQREGKINSLMSAMSTQIQGILGKEKKNDLQHMVVFDVSTLYTQNGSNGNLASGTQQGNAQGSNTGINTPDVPAKPATVIVPAGKIEYAQMILEANSDVPGPVVAMLASGEFSGSKLLGKFTDQEEYLVITFNTLVTKKGTSVPINAFAIDPKTSLTGVATDVDHRYFKRIVLPAAAKFVEGLGEAYSETTTSTTQGVGGTTTSTTDLNTKQEFGKAVSEAAKSVSDVLTEDGKQTKPLVIVASGTPIGILFMDSVTDKALLQARAGVSSSVNPPTPMQQNQMGQYPNNSGQPMTTLQQIQYGLQNQQFLQQGNGNSSMSNSLGQ